MLAVFTTFLDGMSFGVNSVFKVIWLFPMATGISTFFAAGTAFVTSISRTPKLHLDFDTI